MNKNLKSFLDSYKKTEAENLTSNASFVSEVKPIIVKEKTTSKTHFPNYGPFNYELFKVEKEKEKEKEPETKIKEFYQDTIIPSYIELAFLQNLEYAYLLNQYKYFLPDEDWPFLPNQDIPFFLLNKYFAYQFL